MAIELLDEIVANQIAAGEVVSRPASVVKELLENSIDAGATRVQLVVKDAGRTLIQVSDNGCGMDKDDAQKCFLAHATSKIKSSDDLLRLSTMGFRGEALASIAAIAQVELKTRREQDEIGTKVVIEGGVIKEVSETACGVGTCISVKNIFYNTPARRNFLKTEQIETSHINDEFLRVALINPNLAFTYINNEKTLYNLTVGNMKKRIVDLFGKSMNDKLIPISEKIDLVEINGFVCSSEWVKRNKSWQYFFVNGRFMKHSYFANAVDRAFANLILEKTYPAFFITLNLSPENIDVNIHPTKTEVKFLDEKVIYSVLHASVKKAIGQYSLANELDFSKRSIEFPVITSSTPLPKAPQIKFNPNYNPFETNHSETQNRVKESLVVQSSLFEQEELKEKKEEPKIENTVMNLAKNYNLFQVGERYIAVKLKNSFMLIDQSRASMRVIYESILSNNKTQTDSQHLLSPIKHFYPPHISFQLVEMLPILRNYGIEMQYDKQDGGFLLSAKPLASTADECFELAREIIEENTENLYEENAEEKRALKIAQRTKIAYNETLSVEQMQTLVSQLFSCSDCLLTPDGKKIMVKMTLDDIEQLFD